MHPQVHNCFYFKVKRIIKIRLNTLDPYKLVTACGLCVLYTLIRPNRQTGRRARRTASAHSDTGTQAAKCGGQPQQGTLVGFLFRLKKTSHPIYLQEQNQSFHFTL